MKNNSRLWASRVIFGLILLGVLKVLNVRFNETNYKYIIRKGNIIDVYKRVNHKNIL